MTETGGKYYEQRREEMVLRQLITRKIKAPHVLQAMRKVPRHLFVPENIQHEAYADRALPLGPDQTISQPYVVALMMQAAELKSADRLLEIGTGSGYGAAVAAEIVDQVYSIEMDQTLHEQALSALQAAGVENVLLRCADGFQGWIEHAPFDVILVTAAPDHIPRELVRQLTPEGSLILPFGDSVQELIRIQKTETGLKTTEFGGVRFVPMKPKDDES